MNTNLSLTLLPPPGRHLLVVMGGGQKPLELGQEEESMGEQGELFIWKREEVSKGESAEREEPGKR